ncbi:MAG: hypothetical protein LC623_06515, partial [Halobacteriales archaeon]|nr:hypothetical protein [Halobacteriales archaeon]
MKPLKPAFRNAAFAVAFVAILVAADLASGVDLLQQLPLPSSASALRRFQQDVERLWQGGGGQVLFADDFSTYTADWLARQGAGLPGYHGGALPESGDSPDRWAQDLYRWGHAAIALASADGWSMDHDGYTQFGDPAVGYPVGVQSELVSPVIDLRGLPAVADDAQARLSANPDPLGRGSRQCPPSGIDPLAAINSPSCGLSDQGTNATAALGFGDGRETYSPIRKATAALRVRHAYGFHVDPNIGFMDGGRIVVATLDPSTQTWSPWAGLTPTDRVLQLDGEQMRVRTNPEDSAVPLEVRARHNVTQPGLLSGNPGIGAEVIVGDQQTVPVDGQNPQNLPLPQPETRNLDPHLYQGTIVASGSAGNRWRGFGGDSGGMVDSIFDLSAFAGRLVRIGFQAATSPGDEPLVEEAGWRLDELEVHAVGTPTVQVIGLAEPGNGAAIPPGSDVRPTVILQNTGADPVEVVVAATAGSQAGSQRTRLSVGPLGRIHLATGVSFTDIEAGLVPVEVFVRQVVQGTGAGAADAQLPATTTARFHFLAAEASGWEAGRPSFYPDGVEREKATKLVVRGQKANITVPLENVGTAPVHVALGSSRFVDGDRVVVAGDIRAVMVDESGTEYGTMTPLNSGAEVDLPVSRAIAGTQGTPMAARVATWQWSGSDVARALRLQVVDGAQHVLREGGDVMVQTVAPNPLDIDFNNRWNFTAGTPSCTRLVEWGGQQGVVQCPAGQARVASAVRRLFDIDLFRGNETSLLVAYRGGPIHALVQAVQATTGAPDPLPPAGAVWQTRGEQVFNASSAWTTVAVDGPQLPPGFVGHVRLVLESVGTTGFELDEAGLYLKLRNSHGGEVSVPLVADRFDVTLQPSRDAILPTEPSGLVVLDGIDESTQSVGSTEDAVVGTLRPFGIKVENSPNRTRFLEDSVLTLEQPINLAGLGRPVLSFRHWLDTGFHGTATVEVAPAGTVRDVAALVTDAGPGTAGGWRVVARFNGTDTGRDTLPALVSLWDYAGQAIFLRFRFHIDPTILTAEADGTYVSPGYPPSSGTGRQTQDATPVGWIIEGVNVQAWDTDGLQAVHQAGHGFANYTLHGGHVVDDATGHPVSNKKNCWDGKIRLNPACITPRGVSSLMSEPMVLDNLKQPVLTLTHFGNLSPRLCSSGPSFPAIDIEYQRMAGSIPAGPWNAGTPTDGFTWPHDWVSQVGWRRTDQADALPLRTLAGDLHGPPFAGTHALPDRTGCGAGIPTPQPYQFDVREDAFDLSPLTPMAEGATVRLDVWSEKGWPPGNERLVL